MSIFLRKAAMEDAEIILEWRNDPVTRGNSFNKDLIDPKTHKRWFQSRLSDPDCSLFILMDNSECIGQLRIDKVNDVGELSYTIAPEKRGQGYGKKIIGLAEAAAAQTCGVKVLTGLVEKENTASRKCFLRNGYSEFIGGGICSYIKVIG